MNIMPEDNPVAPVPPSGEGSTHVEGTALTLDQLNEKLGTRYQSVDAALNGLKETKNFVGKVGQVQSEATVDQRNSLPVTSMNKMCSTHAMLIWNRTKTLSMLEQRT